VIVSGESLYLNKTIKSINSESAPIIIFGAGIIGEILFHACCIAGIKVDCFCDDKVTGTLCDLSVLHTSELKMKYQDAIFFISSSNIKDMVDRLKDLGYSKWYSCGLMLRDFDLSQAHIATTAYSVEYLEYLVCACLLSHDNYINPEKLFLRNVDIIITERCSLKCKDCSNLMQYYKKPQNCNLEEVLRTIEVFCSYMDEVFEFRVIGGEPFMNKDFHLVVNKLIDESKVRKIAIYTNGTILPSEAQMSCLQNNKVLLCITDYGDLSRKLNELTQELQKKGIVYYVYKDRGWTSCSTVTRYERTIEQNEDVFKKCCAKNLATLSDGKLYRCPFAANASRLKATPDYIGDYINILEMPLNAIDFIDIKNRIRSFLIEKTKLETCDYCNGRPYGAPEITPAIQVDKPLDYKQYC
jgi:organic radical activating enzyme